MDCKSCPHSAECKSAARLGIDVYHPCEPEYWGISDEEIHQIYGEVDAGC